MSYPFTRILVTGGSGFLGQHILAGAPAGTKCLSLYHSRPLHNTPAAQMAIDLEDNNAFGSIVAQWQPDLVIHAAAIADPHRCEKEPALSEHINVTASAQIATVCAAQAIPLVYTSTDLVFDGNTPPYLPAHQPKPVSRYGQQKAAAEAAVRQYNKEAVIARLPVMYGLPHEVRNNVLTALIRQWARGETPSLFTDEYRSFAHAKDVADGLYRIATAAGQTFHLGGPAAVSRFAFGDAVRQILNLPNDRIQPTLQAAVKLAAARPKNVTLDSHTAYALDYRPQSVPEALADLTHRIREHYLYWQNNG